jgi:hypothetical protein
VLQGELRYETEEGVCPKVFAEVNLPHNCTLATDGGLLQVDTDIFGKGLKVNQQENECVKIELCVPDGTVTIAPEQITGDPLTSISDHPKALLYGYVKFDEQENDCGYVYAETYLPLGCHFNTTSSRLTLDLTTLAGEGLSIEQGLCPKLRVDSALYTAGCGIDISATKVISVDLADIATAAAYTWNGENCVPASIVLATGCSTASGLAGTEGVFQLPGLVLFAAGACPTLHARVNLPYNCSLEIDNGNLGLNYGIFTKGLEIIDGDGDCPEIGLCVEDGQLPINFSSMVGDDLTNVSAGVSALVYGQVQFDPTPYPPSPPNQPCKVFTKSYLPVGCHFDVGTGRLILDVNTLAGEGLAVDSSPCPKLKVDIQDLFCDAPTVTPTTSDFVLGLRYTGETCELVKFAITECPTGGGGGGPGPGPGG